MHIALLIYWNDLKCDHIKEAASWESSNLKVEALNVTLVN